MSVLATISKPAPRPPIITVIGDAGTGKTSLAATFPKPVFIRAEDGVGRISRKIEKPDSFPAVSGSAQLFDQLLALLNEDHDYKTLVIDSVTKLEEIFIREILEADKTARGINQALGGYGAGPAAVAAMHMRVRKAAGLLNERKGMAVIFIGHADLESMRLPDKDEYQRYSLRLSSKSVAPYKDDVDLVALVRLESAIVGDDGRKRVFGSGDREVLVHSSPVSVTKNGLGITEPLPFPEGTNPLAAALGISGAAAQTQTKEDEQ